MLYAGPWVAERLAAVGDLVERAPEAIHPSCAASCSARRNKTALQSFQAFYELAELTRLARREWEKIDMLLLPTAGTTLQDCRDACRSG